MNRKEFIRLTAVATTGILAGCSPKTTAQKTAITTAQPIDFTLPTDFTLPALPYPTAALEPFIDQMTMEIHHGKHHATYVNNLNQAIKTDKKFYGQEIEEILATLLPTDTAVRNNGGGHYNHALFWTLLKPNGSSPTGKIADALNAQFGSYDAFKEQFDKSAKSVFGSGWTWLIQTPDNKLLITTTPNQDNPLMKNVVQTQGKPLLALDVWEHAYYLKYQNKRADYINAFFSIINWETVNSRL